MTITNTIVLLSATATCAVLGCGREERQAVPKRTTGSPPSVSEPSHPVESARRPEDPRPATVGLPLETERSLALESRKPSLKIIVKNYRLHVSDGVRSAGLGFKADSVTRVARSEDGRTMTIGYTWGASCGEVDRKQVVSTVHLLALLANSEAFGLHQKKDYAAAEKGFAKAVALDPTLRKAVFNLACAKARQDKTQEAASTLHRYLTTEPVETYSHLAADPDLWPLLEIPSVAAMKSPTPGDARLELVRGDLAHTALWVSQGKHLAAVVAVSESWGAYSFSAELFVFDTESRATLFSKSLVEWDETDPMEGGISPESRDRVKARLEGVNRFLADFGFGAPKRLETGVARGDMGQSAGFPAGRFAVVLTRNGKMRIVRRKDTLLEADFPGGGSMWRPVIRGAWRAVDEGLLAFTWHLADEPEGCDVEQPLAGAAIVALPAL